MYLPKLSAHMLLDSWIFIKVIVTHISHDLLLLLWLNSKAPGKPLLILLCYTTSKHFSHISLTYVSAVQYFWCFLMCCCGLNLKQEGSSSLPSLIGICVYGGRGIFVQGLQREPWIAHDNATLRMTIAGLRQMGSSGIWGLAMILVGLLEKVEG